MAEAFAEYLHKRIRGELGFAAEEARDPEAMLAQGYRGSRYSFGYPACPNLADQKQLLALLGAEEIGITLSEEDQLDPEQSTSAIVVHHPQAKYFSVCGNRRASPAKAPYQGEKSIRCRRLLNFSPDKIIISDTYQFALPPESRGFLAACRGPNRANRVATGWESGRHLLAAPAPPRSQPSCATAAHCAPDTPRGRCR